MTRWISRLLLCLVIGLPALPAQGQQSLRAAAVVNDEVVSGLDLHMRLQLVSLSSGMRNNPDDIRRLAPQVLRNLINERLQLQEAERLGLKVEPAEIREATQRIASRNDIGREQFIATLEQQGVMRETLISRIRANLAWQKVIRRKIRPQVNVTSEEVDDVIERRKSRAGKQVMKTREIFLPAEDGETQQVRRTAERLMQELRNGASFGALARQFSQSATAAVGGDLGWITERALPEELTGKVDSMNAGQIAGPFQARGGFYILGLEDKKRQGVGATTVTLKQLLVSGENGSAGTEALRQRVEGLAGRIEGCGEVASVAESADRAQAIDLGQLKLADMPENIRDTIGGLKVNEISEPIETGGGVGVVVVCDRTTPGLDREEIRNSLLSERMNMLSRRHLRDLRRAAHIDIRIEGLQS